MRAHAGSGCQSAAMRVMGGCAIQLMGWASSEQTHTINFGHDRGMDQAPQTIQPMPDAPGLCSRLLCSHLQRVCTARHAGTMLDMLRRLPAQPGMVCAGVG